MRRGKINFSFVKSRQMLGVPVAVIAAVIVFSMGVPQNLSTEGHRCLALFAGIFVLYLTAAVPLPITSLALCPLAVLIDFSADSCFILPTKSPNQRWVNK